MSRTINYDAWRISRTRPPHEQCSGLLGDMDKYGQVFVGLTCLPHCSGCEGEFRYAELSLDKISPRFCL